LERRGRSPPLRECLSIDGGVDVLFFELEDRRVCPVRDLGKDHQVVSAEALRGHARIAILVQRGFAALSGQAVSIQPIGLWCLALRRLDTKFPDRTTKECSARGKGNARRGDRG
jgi:hypothetical protein